MVFGIGVDLSFWVWSRSNGIISASSNPTKSFHTTNPNSTKTMPSNPTVSTSSATPFVHRPNSLPIPYSRLLRSKVNRTPRRGLDQVGPRRRRRRNQVRRSGAKSQGRARPRTCEVSGTWSRTHPIQTSHGEWWDWGASRCHRMKWRLWDRLEREWRRKDERWVREGREWELGERVWGFWLLGFYSLLGFMFFDSVGFDLHVLKIE